MSSWAAVSTGPAGVSSLTRLILPEPTDSPDGPGFYRLMVELATVVGVATMNIKDPEVHRLAHELAVLRRTSATGAVREALQEAIDREQQPTRSEVAGRLRDIAARGRALTGPRVPVEDLYDPATGAPR